ncbi:glycosyltransferase family 4 protein [Bradyrhizobium sp. AZCC 2230]|uniref:glycosyltransferase family 4 protein n=1 Tax=Bradyrhizobium sp. AZCC 2230 TaxID=3117021 RepID=UPI002FF1AFF5
MRASVVYLLHRFPRVTDTFIFREIRALQNQGLSVKVVSVWHPKDSETLPQVLKDWEDDVSFLLPANAMSAVGDILKIVGLHPIRFVDTFLLALRTSRPGLKGLLFQLFYLMEALLAASRLRGQRGIQLHNHFGDQSGTVTMLAARFCRLPYSISFHGPHIFFDPLGQRIKNKALSAAFNRCISSYCRSQIMLFMDNYEPARCPIVHCGVNSSAYSYRDPGPDVSRILSVARLAPEKGFRYLLEAFSAAARNNPAVQLRLAGDGPTRFELQEQARLLGIAERVVFLGRATEAEIRDELAAADIFVLPSLAEGLPVSLMEAMSVGVPAIATNVAAVGELIDDGLSGRLVPPTDASSLERALLELMHDHEKRIAFARAGRIKIEAEFELERETLKLAEEFEKVAVA